MNYKDCFAVRQIRRTAGLREIPFRALAGTISHRRRTVDLSLHKDIARPLRYVQDVSRSQGYVSRGVFPASDVGSDLNGHAASRRTVHQAVEGRLPLH